MEIISILLLPILRNFLMSEMAHHHSFIKILSIYPQIDLLTPLIVFHSYVGVDPELWTLSWIDFYFLEFLMLDQNELIFASFFKHRSKFFFLELELFYLVSFNLHHQDQIQISLYFCNFSNFLLLTLFFIWFVSTADANFLWKIDLSICLTSDVFLP